MVGLSGIVLMITFLKSITCLVPKPRTASVIPSLVVNGYLLE